MSAIFAFRPSAPSRSALLLLVAVVGGVGISLQVFLNGRLGESLGSVELAAATNTTTALVALVVIAALTGTRARAVEGLRQRPVRRWWHWIVGVNGAIFMLFACFAAPRLGVALLTVALVCGQTIGSLLVDHLGMSPAGRQTLTTRRVAGAALALVAVAIGSLGGGVDPQPVLMGCTILVGVLVPIQQAALGHLAHSTGEPLAAGVINFVVGAAILLMVALWLTGGHAPNGWSAAPPVQWLGGLLGATLAVLTARLVPRIGVLRLMLALVAGQSLGALALDLVAPGAGSGVTVVTLLGVLLTLVAVTVGSSSRRDPATAPGDRPRVAVHSAAGGFPDEARPAAAVCSTIATYGIIATAVHSGTRAGRSRTSPRSVRV